MLDAVVVDTFMKSKRNILQTVPATDWDAICVRPDSHLVRIRIAFWAITELTAPPVSFVAGLDADGQLFDERPEFIGYAHKSTPTEAVLARLPGKSAPNAEMPWRAAQCFARLSRVCGLLKNAEYPDFEILVDDTFRGKGPNWVMTPDLRSLLAIMPATDAHAVYSIDAGRLDHQPIFVWALIEDVDGSHKVVGIDAQNFPCDEWTNFVGYEPQPPKPDEFQPRSE